MTDETPAERADPGDVPVPLTGDQKAVIVQSLTAGAPPQKACADAGVDPLRFFAALADDAEFALQLGRLEALRSLNVLAITYQKALSGTSADRSLYLKFRPPPPAAPTDEETVELDGPIGAADEEQLEGELNV